MTQVRKTEVCGFQSDNEALSGPRMEIQTSLQVRTFLLTLEGLAGDCWQSPPVRPSVPNANILARIVNSCQENSQQLRLRKCKQCYSQQDPEASWLGCRRPENIERPDGMRYNRSCASDVQRLRSCRNGVSRLPRFCTWTVHRDSDTLCSPGDVVI